MVGPPARRGDRRFSRRPRGAVARRLCSQGGAGEVGGLFAYVSSLGFLFCFSFLVLLVLRGVSVAQCGFLPPPPRTKRAATEFGGLVRPQGKRQRILHALRARVFRTVSFRSPASSPSVFIGR